MIMMIEKRTSLNRRIAVMNMIPVNGIPNWVFRKKFAQEKISL